VVELHENVVGLGHGFWDYAARYAAVTIVKISNRQGRNLSLEELTGSQPNLPSILRFGSLCFVHIPKKSRSKASFETTKAVEGRILGQEDNVSGWIVRLDGSGKLVRSRDVRVATGATVPATQQAPIDRPDRSQQDEQIDLVAFDTLRLRKYHIMVIIVVETLQDLDDENSFGHTSLKRKNFQQNLHQLRLQMSKGEEETHQGRLEIMLGSIIYDLYRSDGKNCVPCIGNGLDAHYRIRQR
jgi:hypothetical protein